MFTDDIALWYNNTHTIRYTSPRTGNK